MKRLLLLSLVACGGEPSSVPSATPSTPASPTPISMATPTETTRAAQGAITVSVRDDWGAVWIDGEQVTDETPLNMWDIDPGSHEVRVSNPEDQRELYRGTVDVNADEMVIIHIHGEDARLERVSDY